MLYNFWFWKFYFNTNLLCALKKRHKLEYIKRRQIIYERHHSPFFARFLCGLGSLGFFYLLYLPLRYIPDDECHYFLILLLRCRFLESFLKDKSIVLMKSIQIYSIVVFQKGSFSSLLELLRVFLQ